MADSKYFSIPFGTSGDKATIPEAVQPGGSISYAQGFGPDYERDPETDPLAKRVPRDETNEFYYQVSNALKFLQLYGAPEWYALDDSGNAVSYPVSAQVRHDAGAGMQVWRSLVATNVTEPGTDATKWALDEAFSFTSLEASIAEAVAGTVGGKVLTPRRLASALQSHQFMAGAAGGTANALSLTLAPVPANLASLANKILYIVPSADNTAAATININGFGAVPVVRADGSPLQARDIRNGVGFAAVYTGAALQMASPVRAPMSATTVVSVSGNFNVPAGVTRIKYRIWGGGGGGGGGPNAAGSFAGTGGGGGGYTEGFASVTPGQVLACTVGAGGSPGPVFNSGGVGGTSAIAGIAQATGGSGGNYQSAASTTASPGGAGSLGAVNLGGQNGSIVIRDGSTGNAIGGMGGVGAGGGGGGGVASNAAPDVGKIPGGGGGGAGGPGGFNGGGGANGLIILEY